MSTILFPIFHQKIFSRHFLQVIYRLGFLRRIELESGIEVFGLRFPNRIGLAAGLDKNGEYIDALSCLGFGFIEIGTVTPKAQSGNPRPRLFRLVKHQAIINRLGFNNKGVDYVVDRVKQASYKGILGINIGKNRDTPLELAVADYVFCFKRVALVASYVTINISSPNTEGLRELQQEKFLRELLRALKEEQRKFFESQKKYVPLVVKIAPDLSDGELKNIAEVLLAEKIDGVIATNTTLSRKGVSGSPFAKEAGGLSGKPLTECSTEIIGKLALLLQNQIPIIGCGGVFSAQDVQDKMAAGASLVQIYSGLIYQGPNLIRHLQFLKKFSRKNK